LSAALYFDHNIHAEIVRLVAATVDCLTSQDDGRARLLDEPLMDRAIALGRAMVSNDLDMFTIAQRRIATGAPFCGLIRVRQDAVTVAEAAFEIALLATVYEAPEWQDRIEYVPM
jgi:predicted nuclease of predicted toxin-antitoxin system